MKKICIILSSLTLSIILLLSIGFSVMAAKPEEPKDNKPVAWVSLGGSNGNSKDVQGTHGHMSLLVKKLSNGNTIGHFYTVNLTGKMVGVWEIVNSHFEEDNGVKIAYVLTKFQIGPSFYLYNYYKFEDRGEPGPGNDVYSFYGYVPMNEPPEIWPPAAGDHSFPLQIDIPIVSSNIQVHISADYPD